VFLTAALICSASRAFAQNPDPVETAKMHLGPLALTPTIGLTNLGIDANVFNDPKDASPKRDFTLTLEPRVDLWMHAGPALVSGTVTQDFVYYKTYATERSVNGTYRLGALVRKNRLSLNGNVTHVDTRDRPGFEIDARSQRYELGYDGAVELQAAPRSVVGVKATRVNIDFAKDAVFLGSSLRDELTRTETSTAASFRYSLTPMTTVTLDVGLEQDRFSYSPLRDSDSTRVKVNFDFDPFAILKGRAAIGYRHLQPRTDAVPRYKGSTADVDLEYLPFGATKVGLKVIRDIQYSFDIERPYYVLTGTTVSVSQHVHGQIFVVGTVGVQRLAYRDLAGAVIAVSNRKDYVHTYGGGLGYRLGASVRLNVNIDRVRRTTAIPGRDYDDVRFGTAITYGQ
jgi:hypothetical protein